MKSNLFLKFGIIFLIVVTTLGLRIYSAQRLYIDYDEPVYLDAALAYNNQMRSGQWAQIAWYDENHEHPALYKVLYGAVLMTQEPLHTLWEKDLKMLMPIEEVGALPWLMAGRYTSVVLSTLAIFILALLNPFAAALLSIHSLGIDYTSIFYLEALPFLTSLLSVICYQAWYNNISSTKEVKKKMHLWLLASAIFLGMTAAGKYVYCVAGLAIVAHFFLSWKTLPSGRKYAGVILGWMAVSLAAFFLFNPYLWPHPLERLIKSISFHLDFAGSAHVIKTNYPFWQPLIWLSASMPDHFPELKDSFLLKPDTLIAILAILGLPGLWKKKEVYFYWLVIGLTVLLVWNTKWPQYVMIILVPFSISAAEGGSMLFIYGKRLVKWIKGTLVSKTGSS